MWHLESSSKMSLKAGVAIRTIRRDIEVMQEKGILVHRGGCKDGEWVIILITRFKIWK